MLQVQNYLTSITKTEIIIIISAFIILVIWILHKRERKRSEELEKAAISIGFSFAKNTDISIINTFGNFPLFKKGRPISVSNFFRGKRSKALISVFDYTHMSRAGKSRNTSRHTALVAEMSSVNLPIFTICPETFFHKIGQAIGMKDIDFIGHPVFSDMYCLKGKDEEAITDAFSQEVVIRFEQKLINYTIECDGKKLLIYSINKRIKSTDILKFIEEAIAITKIFDRE
jgi:hypothetical protein